MKNFSIRELENFSQIKAHTLRIWEHRYAIFKPNRTKGNIRFYNLGEVKLLLDIVLLTKNGYRISSLTNLDATTLAQKSNALSTDEAMQNKSVSQLILAMFSSDIEQFEYILDNCVLCWDTDTTIHNIIIPFLEKVQILSYNDSSSNVHFVVTAIRKKMILALERVSPSVMLQKSALLFLPEGEHYDLMLLYMAYILKSNGLKVLYMGTNISKENLETVSISKRPDFLFTYTPQKKKFKLHQFFPCLDSQLTGTTFFVAGCENSHHQKEKNRDNVKFIHYSEVLNMVKENQMQLLAS
jgi:DNA-binding transcriptional MerR regulator